MKKIEKLRKQALEACQFRGHKMQPFSRKYRHWWGSKCKICGKGVVINDQPDPNGIDICGEAIALSCND